MKWIISCIFAFGSLFGAGPMTHLYLAERFCEIHGIANQKDFLIGSIFPDIRYIGHISRKRTHPSISHIKEVLAAKNSFEAGMRFHTWVDIVREQFVEESGIYDKMIPHAEGHEATLLKFIEEEILADFYDGRKWSSCFEEILQEEIQFDLPRETIERWHALIQYSMQYRPSWLLWGSSYFQKSLFGISNSTLYNWSYFLTKAAQDPYFRDHMTRLLQYIELQL